MWEYYPYNRRRYGLQGVRLLPLNQFQPSLSRISIDQSELVSRLWVIARFFFREPPRELSWAKRGTLVKWILLAALQSPTALA